MTKLTFRGLSLIFLISFGSSWTLDRRKVLSTVVLSTPPLVAVADSRPGWAYTPDADPLRESLYLISRAQEATVQQERLANNKALSQAQLKTKMKLSLKLVDRSYRLLDQINYCSQFVSPPEALVVATEAGNEAVDALQDAIYFVNNELSNSRGPLTEAQRNFLVTAMQTTRNELFTFVQYLPQDKLQQARLRIERENVDNREEFDGPDDAGVYNPVKLPWK